VHDAIHEGFSLGVVLACAIHGFQAGLMAQLHTAGVA
jgi:hypothetical protein